MLDEVPLLLHPGERVLRLRVVERVRLGVEPLQIPLELGVGYCALRAVEADQRDYERVEANVGGFVVRGEQPRGRDDFSGFEGLRQG